MDGWETRQVGQVELLDGWETRQVGQGLYRTIGWLETRQVGQVELLDGWKHVR